MTSWLALSFLVLLSANTVFSNDYKDKLIDEDPYLSQCFVSTGTGDLKQDGVKKIHSGPECYAKSKIKFKVEDIGTDFYVFQEQGDELAGKATVKYKFGECFQVVIEIKKDDEDKIVYTLQNPDDGSEIKLEKGFMFRIKRRAYRDFTGSDHMEVLKEDYTPYISKECKAFERDMGDLKAPTLMDFEQEVEGVPNLTLIWKVPLGEKKKYFGIAIAQKIIELETTTSTTTTTAEPTTLSSTTSKPSTTSSLVSSTATNTTVAPTDLVDEVKEEAFPWWIIAVVAVGVLLLLIGLVVGYLCWRRRRAQKPKPVAPQTETTVGTTMETTVQEKSQYGPNMMYFARDAKPTDPAAAPK